MKEIKFTHTITADEYKYLTQPCIYVWKRRERWLYVGQSKNGIIRPFGPHHVIDSKELVLAIDHFEFYWKPEGSPEDHLDYVEEELIKREKPVYNQVKNPNYERRITDKNLCRLQQGVPTKKEVAKVLFSQMPERPILEDPQNCSDNELTEFIRNNQEWNRQFKKWRKMK